MSTRRQPTCRSCGRPLTFRKTNGDKWMPCDPEKVRGDEIEGYTIITLDGRVVKNPDADEIGFVPHWATCRKPELFRKEEV